MSSHEGSNQPIWNKRSSLRGSSSGTLFSNLNANPLSTLKQDLKTQIAPTKNTTSGHILRGSNGGIPIKLNLNLSQNDLPIRTMITPPTNPTLTSTPPSVPQFNFISQLSDSLNSKLGNSLNLFSGSPVLLHQQSQPQPTITPIDQTPTPVETPLSNSSSAISTPVQSATPKTKEEVFLGSFPSNIIAVGNVPVIQQNEQLQSHRTSAASKFGASQAVRVDYHHQTLGYLPLNIVAWLAPLLDSGFISLQIRARGNSVLQVAPSNVINVVIDICLQRSNQGIGFDGNRERDQWNSLSRAINVPVTEIISKIARYQSGGNLRMRSSQEGFTLNGSFDSIQMEELPFDKKRSFEDAQMPMSKKQRSQFGDSADGIDLTASGNLIPMPGDTSIEQHLDQLYANLTKKVLPEMEPDEKLAVTLRSYQKQALWWMVDRERPDPEASKLPASWKEMTTVDGKRYYYNPVTQKTSWHYPYEDCEGKTVTVRGGILADDMGMGKTVETISLIVTNRCHDLPHLPETMSTLTPSKATLIVCPLSVLQQWGDEIVKHTPEGMFKIYVYHGATRNRDASKLAEFDVVLTTFATLAAEIPAESTGKTGKKKEKIVPAVPAAKGGLMDVFWHRIVLDEAHTIKDKSTRTAKAAYQLKSTNRWAVTGTPIQNKLDDMFSLLHFLQVEPYGDYSWWSRIIMKPIRNHDDRGFTRLQTILEKILLRRTKDEKIEGGKSIVNLPPKVVRIRRIEAKTEESEFYQKLWNSSKDQFDDFLKSGKVMENYAHILELLLRLRQACDHPKLVKKSKKQVENSTFNLKTISQMLSQASPEMFKRLETVLAKGINYDDEECSICLEKMEEAVATPCGHVFCKRCIENHLGTCDTDDTCPICRRPVIQSLLIPIPNVPKESEVEENSSSQWESSSKIDALMEELGQIEDASVKSIVFSQWTSMLDLVEISLNSRGIKFVRLDGSQTQTQREKSVSVFKSDPTVRVFLISMKAGGLGLNLTVASHVYVLDPWWNPSTEEQAIDRVHRLGQTRPVHVTRFIMAGSIEERILELQEGKKRMAQGALGMDAKDLRQIRIDELRLLFRD
eukprot:TRINITY_DN3826_c0_g1_i1.p1 TRINITY_DN3826_c0_g1~~TRINITY_DN3826_c0_g1_i1.p1  ORF type:complete len:1079 (-),score=279.78 TRINITY_DN3826_c0_g1_i1:71-3307(-)